MLDPARQGTPFPFEGPIPPELLIDRQGELDLLARRAGDRVSVRLVAPRRYGKTSVLLAHARRLRETGWRTAHVDFSRVADLTDVARRFATAYAELDLGWTRAHLAAPLARLGVTLTPAGPGVSMAMRPPASDPLTAELVLDRVLDLPLRLWEADRTPTLVVFDEFQDLLTARENLDGLLRSRIQYHGDAAAYVYAGSEPSMMRELFDVRERPLFGQADPLELGPLPVDEVLADLAQRFADERQDPGEALTELVVFAGGHPQRTMLLCYLLSDRIADGEQPTPALAAQIIDDAIDRTRPAHQALWGQLGRSERIVLAAVADGQGPTSRALAAEHNLSRATLDAAAERLSDQGHVIRRPRGTRLVDPLLAEWLRRR
ncbi:MAG TPA: helix-turn-helix domain-containing protein [Solirubrobacter sp.]|nr:helix-turn-helix domain-containing protein [Solirubrobacter sp.]